MTEPVAIVIPVGPDDRNDELRYTLRALERNFPDHGPVFVVGYKPGWLINVEHIEGNPAHGRPHINVYRNILIAAEDPRVPDQFLAFNDDFFITEPVDEIPVAYKERLIVQVERAARSRSKNTWWNRSLAFTLQCLRDAGYDDPLSYELHMPLPVDKVGMAKALRMFVDVADEYGDPPQWRTLYGNVNQVGGIVLPDCKARGASRAVHVPFFSTDASSWRIFGRRFAARYPQPSPYEKVYPGASKPVTTTVRPTLPIRAKVQTNDDELAWLYDKARGVPAGQACVELGVYQGGSLRRIADGANAGNHAAVIGVDAWDRRVYMAHPHWNRHYGTFSHRRVAEQLVPEATLVQAMSLDAAKTYDGPPIGLLFIDADHDYPSAMQDLRAWRTYLADGAWVAFDDYSDRFPGVKRCVDELVAEAEIGTVEVVGGRMAVAQLVSYEPQSVLDGLFFQYGTDKGSWHQPRRAVHNYHRPYETLFTDRRDSIASVLEVGIGSETSIAYCMAPHYRPGGSLRAWADYFPNARIIGLDMTSEVSLGHPRITTVLADSRNLEQVNAALPTDTMFDVIIDDGDHQPDAQFATLTNLWDRLNPGGIYVIEDIMRKADIRKRAAEFTGTDWAQHPNTLIATTKPGP